MYRRVGEEKKTKQKKKVEASLLTECQPYGKYSHTVGTCDCGQSGCVTEELKSGYTEEFNWVAASYKVMAC